MILRLSAWPFIEICLALAVFVLPFSKSLLEAALWTALSAWIVRKIVLREPWSAPRSTTWLFALFLAVTAASVLQAGADERWTAWRGFFKWLKFIGLFFVCEEACRDERRARRIRRVLFAGMTLIVVDGFWQIIGPSDFLRQVSVDVPGRGIRIQGPFASPNDLAGYLLVGLPLAFAAWVGQKRWSRKSAGLVLLVVASGIALISTLSRAALLALAASSALVFALRRRFAALAILGAAAAGAFLASPALRQNAAESLGGRDITVGERLRFWDVSRRMIEAKPWTGHGVNSYYRAFGRFAPAEETYRGYAHNCYLQMACEIGLPGLALFLAGLFWVLGRALEAGPDLATDALIVSLLAFLFQSFVDTHFYSLPMAALFWIFFGMLAAQARRSA